MIKKGIKGEIMKNVFLLLAASFFLMACGGPRYAVVPLEEHGHKQVVEVSGADRQLLFDRASEWIAINYVSGKDVVQEKNLKTGRIIGRGITTIEVDSGGLVNTYARYSYSMIIDVKAGRARIQLGDYTHVDYGTNPQMALFVRPLNVSMKELAADFELYLRTGGAGTVAGSNDEW